MNLLETKAAYERGDLTKHEYIDARHVVHSALFEYAAYLPQTDIARIEITDNQVVMTARQTGVRFVCSPTDKRIAPLEMLNFGSYESEEFSLFSDLCDDGARVFDIGANIGWFSLSLAALKPSVVLNAFEPLPDTFGYLQKNVALNTVPNLTIHNFGFSSEEKELRFFFYPEGSGNASSQNLSERVDAQEVVCQVKRLDDFVASGGYTIDLIKCDVEGAELMVLQGGRETLRAQKPIVFTEMLRKWAAKFDYHPNEIIALMAELGYGCYWAENKRLNPITTMTDETRATNFFFFHNDKHAEKVAALRAG